MLRREAECQSDIERLQRPHLPVEPRIRVFAKAIGPAQTGSQMLYPKFLQPGDSIVETMILEMEPLANTERGRVIAEMAHRQLRRAVFAQQPHVEMPVIGRTFGLPMPRGCGPCARQVIEAVPVNALRFSDQQFRRFFQAEFLDLFRPERGNTDLGDPDGKTRNRANLLEL